MVALIPFFEQVKSGHLLYYLCNNMKKRLLSYITLTLIAAGLMAFAEGKTKKHLLTREWMSDAYLQMYFSYYTYDDQGRVIRAELMNPDTFVTLYIYTPLSILSITHNSAHTFYDTVIYTLNADGTLASDNRNNVYKYDANGKLIKGADDQTYTGAGDDIATHTYINGTKLHTVSYTYTDIADMRSWGDGILAVHSAHLVHTETDQASVKTHRYTFDTQGRPILDSAGADIYHYYY